MPKSGCSGRSKQCASNSGGADHEPSHRDTVSDFKADTTEGMINFHDWISDVYAMLF